MSIFDLYLLTRLFEIKETMAGLLALSGIATFGLGLLAYLNQGTKGNDRIAKYAKRSLIVFFIAGTVSILAPSERDAYVIMGGYYATNNEEIKQLPENIVNASNAFLKNYVEKTKTHDKQD